MSRTSLGKSLIRILVALSLVVVASLVTILVVFTQPGVTARETTIPTSADAGRLRLHVEFLCGQDQPRNSDHPDTLRSVADYIAEEFSSTGGRVDRQVFQARGATYENIVASFGPKTGPLLVIGAHYDVFGELPGADDNASGVSVVLELARLLGEQPPTQQIELVAYSLEEPPFFGSDQMGSAVHAESLRDSGRIVSGMIAVEMVGYYSPKQSWNNWLLSTIYPSRGHFVMIAGRWKDKELSRYVKSSFRGATSIPVRTFVGPRKLAVDASDHLSYWNRGYSAVILTDTAYIRNHNYHTARDTPDTLDYGQMAMVVEGLFGVVQHAGEL